MLKMDETTAHRIYDILVREAGADNREWRREDFVFHMTVSTLCREFRFGGALGFGGKFWRDSEGWWVNAYREDMTPLREEIINNTNTQLSRLAATVRSKESV